MFNEKEFIDSIRKKAKAKGLVEETEKELELFARYEEIEYLFVVNEFVKRIRKECVPGTMLRQAGASSYVAYLLGFHNINPKGCHLFNTLFFNKEYADGMNGPRFDFSIPRVKKEVVLKVLDEIEPIDWGKSKGSTFFFGENGKYRIGIFTNEYLGILNRATKLIKEGFIGNWCNKDFSELKDPRVLDYMFTFDNKGYLMPHLHGCIMGVKANLYQYMEASELHSLYDLALLNCLQWGVFKDKEMVIRSLKEEGLSGTICCREQVMDMLINVYDIEETTVLSIMENLFNGHSLSEGEELFLRSHEVPERIIAQLNNINFLHYLASSLEEVSIAYYLAEIKSFFIDEYESLIQNHFSNAFIGPFFFINGKIYAYKDAVGSFPSYLRFFDSNVSHFDYFESLSLEGDYGNYPRGRVLFDNFHQRFVVYLDKDLLTSKAKETIIEEFNLGIYKYRTYFKKDPHYTHDNL